MGSEDIEELRSQWSTLYSQTLPKLARAKDKAQPKWPVTLDHCFARIILDNTIGEGVLQWDKVIKKPAVRNMDASQLQQAIELGERIQHGQINLCELDQISLQARGKNEKKYNGSEKRKRDGDTHWKEQTPPKKPKKTGQTQSTLQFVKKEQTSEVAQNPHPSSSTSVDKHVAVASDGKSFPNPNTPEFLAKLQNHASLTTYRKRLYSTLLSVPPGTYTTYQAMATYLNSSARAVGSGMRNNPYAPDVPCHRVLASDGSIGGFHGDWGEEGKHASKKRDLLRSEGVYFDSKGRVKGPVFRNFEDLSKV